MASYTGANATLALKLGNTFGTATALGAGDKLTVDSFSRSENVTALERTPVGSGDLMKTDSQRGKSAPAFTITGELGYNDPTVSGLVQFFGAQSTLAGATIGTHSLYFNEVFNSKFATLGVVPLSGSVIEYASAACTKVGLSVSDPADYLKVTMDWLANSEKTSGTTNSAATIEGTTVADSTPVVVQLTDEFLINAQTSGALTTATHYILTKFSILSSQRSG